MADEPKFLPHGVISEILSFLPIEDILRCRTVCKAWNERTRDPDFIDKQFKRATTSQRDRIVFIPRSMMKRNIYLLNPEEKKVRRIPVNSITRDGHGKMYEVMGSCCGFICLASRVFSFLPMFVMNPITLESVKLPRVEPLYPFIHAALGYDPSSDKYKVVRVYKSRISGICKGHIITLGETAWRPFLFPYRVRDSKYSPAVYHDGGLYWVVDERHHLHKVLVFMDMETESFETVKFPRRMRTPKLMGYGENLSLVRERTHVSMAEYKDSVAHVWNIRRSGFEAYSIDHSRFQCGATAYTARWRDLPRQIFAGRVDDNRHLLVMSKKEGGDREIALYCTRLNMYLRFRIRGRLPRCIRPHTLQPHLLSSPIVTARRDMNSQEGPSISNTGNTQ